VGPNITNLQVAQFALTTASAESVAHILEDLPGPTPEIAGAVTDASLSIALSGELDAKSIAGHVTSAASGTAVAIIIGTAFGGFAGFVAGTAAGLGIDYLTDPAHGQPSSNNAVPWITQGYARRIYHARGLIVDRKKLYLLFYPGKLPKEYARTERVSTYIGAVGLFLFGILLFPTHRYLSFVGAGYVTFCLGRLVGLNWQDRLVDRSTEVKLGAVQRIGIGVFVALVATALAAELYWTWTTGAPVFAMQSILGIAVLTYPLGKGRAKLILGIVDVALVIVSLILYFLLAQVGFLAVAAFAAFMAWALLFKAEEPESASTLQSPRSENN
jgi:hypothetical protein